MSLTAFLKENVLPAENVRFAPSDRFIGEDGKPVEWEIRAITAAEDEEIRRACTRRVPVPGKKNLRQPETDYDEYCVRLAAACTVFPDLNSRELQDSWGVMGAENLLRVMLKSGEFAEYIARVQEICGYDRDVFSDEVEEAKN